MIFFSMFKTYTGELQFLRNSFINDPLHNTLQADLWDFEMAEVLGRIETTALANFESADWDWSQGHYLVVVWPTTLEVNFIYRIKNKKKIRITTFSPSTHTETTSTQDSLLSSVMVPSKSGRHTTTHLSSETELPEISLPATLR